jgi:uncharacterized membrane protein
MIPVHKLGGRRRYFKVMAAIVLASTAFNLAWLLIAAKFLVSHVMPGVNAGMQLSQMLTHPLHYMATIISTLSQYMNFYIQSFFGTSLGWFDIPIHAWITLVYTIAVIFLAICDNKYGVHFGKKRKGIMILVSLIIAVLIFSSIYIQYNRVGNSIVEGIQGRYFMPIALLLFYLLNNKFVKIELKEKQFNFLIGSLTILLEFPVLIMILIHHIA